MTGKEKATGGFDSRRSEKVCGTLTVDRDLKIATYPGSPIVIIDNFHLTDLHAFLEKWLA